MNGARSSGWACGTLWVVAAPAAVAATATSASAQAGDGRIEFGLSLNRLTVHSNERVTFPRIDPAAPLARLKPSRYQRVSIEGVIPGRSLRVVPYASASDEGVRQPDPAASPWTRLRAAEFGADLKASVGANLTFDLTVNTDFAETEIDDPQVNFTRFRVRSDLKLDRLEFRTRDERQWSQLARLRLFAAASPTLTLTAAVQSNSLAKAALVNVRLRYNPSEGNDLWLLYGYLENLDRDRITPTIPRAARSGLLVKVTRAFGL